MKRRFRFISKILISILVIVATCLTGCTNIDGNLSMPTESPLASPLSKATAAPSRDPIELRKNIISFDDVTMLYPVLMVDESKNSMNTAIVECVNEFYEQHSNEIVDGDYTVAYNNDGVFSLLLYGYTDNENLTYLKAITFDCDTGSPLSINQLFDPETAGWRTVIPEYISQYAHNSGMMLFSDPKAIGDTRQFYLTENSLVLIYGLYEITLFRYGQPRFYVTYDKLWEYLSTDSLILRIAL